MGMSLSPHLPHPRPNPSNPASEGDVDGIMDRPAGSDDASRNAREKYDAWKANAGLSRTEAKRRYISALISTMRTYAASAPDERALIDELEFVWDQVKSNVSSDHSSDSPTHPAVPTSPSLHRSTSHPHPPVFSVADRSRKRLSGMSAGPGAPRSSQDLRHVTGSPLTHSVVDDDSDDDDAADLFVDAPDSQIAEPPPDARALAEEQKASKQRSSDQPKDEGPRKTLSADSVRWRRRVSAALVKLTAEIAAVREQLEAGNISRAQGKGWGAWLRSLVGSVLKLVALDILILAAILLWLRHKKDGRLEGAIRVLLGDAVAQVQRVGTGVQREVQKVVKGARGKAKG